MKRFFIYLLIYFFLLFIIPVFTVQFTLSPLWGKNAENTRLIKESLGDAPYKIKSYIKGEDKIEEFPLEEYLLGVVAAEMPGSFPDEALKAQAIAARTHIVSRVLAGESNDSAHKGAAVCTDPAHCKAWTDFEALKKEWEKAGENYGEKIENAVRSTSGEIILYDGKPISAVYYSMSSGNTENASDVWGGDVPYLKSVNSSFDENAPNFNSAASFTTDEFKRVILKENSEANLGENPELWIGEIKTSQGGGVLEIEIGGKYFKGTRIRTLFSLRSHNFTIAVADGIVTFNVKGYGHGVGMSQWGCNFLAKEGKNCYDILKYYYSGVEIGKLPS